MAYDFITKARAVHGDRYDYSQTIYTGRRNSLKIGCTTHGQFEQKAGNHLSGSGCRQCFMARFQTAAKERGVSIVRATDFITKARAVHGDRYDYSQTTYTGVQASLSIVCKQHGRFQQEAGSHLRGKGCPSCGLIKQHASCRLTLETLIARARAVHGERFEYTALADDSKTVTVICREHGEFKQRVTDHITLKRGCPTCCKDGLSYDLPSFIRKAVKVHGDRYDYSQAVYTDSVTPMLITCRVHGQFEQTAHVHLRPLKGAGCPRCHNLERPISSGEGEMRAWLGGLTEVVQNERQKLKPFEIDAWLPEYNIGVEYHGLYWHSERHKRRTAHQEKYLAARASGIKLIQIFEDEWSLKNELVKSLILAKLGKSPTRVYARKCYVCKIPCKSGRAFFSENHLQGADSSADYYGLFFLNELLACISFTKTGAVAKLQRFACLKFHAVPGGFSRLLKAFLRDNCQIKTVVTYANLRYSTGEVYLANGFSDDGITTPGYFYSKMGTKPTRESRQRYQVHKLKKLGYSGTERSITTELGLARVYDAGHARLLLRL